MPVLTMPSKPAVRSLTSASISRTWAYLICAVRGPFNLPRWMIVAAAAVLVLGSYAIGRRHPAHHYVAYFGYPMVLDTTTGKACYAVPPLPENPASAQNAAYPLDGTASSLDAQQTSGSQIPLCSEE